MPATQRTKWPIVALDSGLVAITAEQVRRERKRRRMNQQELADAAGVSLRTIRRVEAGSPQSARNFEAIADVLGLPTGNEVADGKLLRDATVHECLQRVQELYDEATRRPTEPGRIYMSGAPELDEEGLLPGPTRRTNETERPSQDRASRGGAPPRATK